ncbi:DUF397 domain-containing protein [Streptomyces sp. NPDC048001]|uniref:DUF397 domain-containing protein n=1 Tax=Streptomyces sanyensis TaxID=568869 RepID=A0ABP9AAQ6_9ACTN
MAHGTPGTIPVRDSKNPDRPNLTFHTAPWTTFLTHLKREERDGEGRLPA